MRTARTALPTAQGDAPVRCPTRPPGRSTPKAIQLILFRVIQGLDHQGLQTPCLAYAGHPGCWESPRLSVPLLFCGA